MQWETLQWHHLSQCATGNGQFRLAAFRLSACVVVFATLSYGSYTYWYFLTDLCWTLLGLYMLVVGLLSLRETLGGNAGSGAASALGCSVWVLFEIMCPAAVFIFLLVWLYLIPESLITQGNWGAFLEPRALIMHNVNVVIMAIEARLNGLVLLTPHVVFLLYFGEAYVALSFWSYRDLGYFVYSVLDFTTPLAAAFYPGLLIFAAICFLAVQTLVTLLKPKLADMAELPGEGGGSLQPIRKEASKV